AGDAAAAAAGGPKAAAAQQTPGKTTAGATAAAKATPDAADAAAAAAKQRGDRVRGAPTVAAREKRSRGQVGEHPSEMRRTNGGLASPRQGAGPGPRPH